MTGTARSNTELFEERGDGAHLAVAPAYRDEIARLRLLETGQLEALLAAGTEHAGGRAGVCITALPDTGRKLLVRPFAHGGLMRALTGPRLLGLARPLTELAVTAELTARGAPVPEPAFVVGRRHGPFWHATIATAFQPGALNGGAFLRSEASRERRLDGVRAAARSIRQLHDAGGRHADLHVDNLLVVAGTGDRPETRVVVVDLDRARLEESVAPERRMVEVMRLYRSLHKRGLGALADARTCAAFLAAYTRGDRRLRAAMLAHAPRERARVRVHALAYSAGREVGRGR